jgi:hypothetical protein
MYEILGTRYNKTVYTTFYYSYMRTLHVSTLKSHHQVSYQHIKILYM